MGLYYIGAFPPDYGGVTIKNHNLFEALRSKTEIQKVDLSRIKRCSLKEALRLTAVLLNPRNQFVLGPSGQRRALTELLYFINRKAMKRSVILLMGGTAAARITADPAYRKWASCYRKIYAETDGMIRQMENAGMSNGALYPNGRFKAAFQPNLRKELSEPMRCVFFSQISREKGADLVLRAAKNLPNTEFCFYGKIVDSYRAEFLNEVSNLNNVKNCGIFKGSMEEVYTELGKYDLMLFPTRMDCEGVPGVLVEAKISGLVPIVSDLSFNGELVHDGADGIVLPENTAEHLTAAISALEADRQALYDMKSESLRSADRFYIENYTEQIISELQK